MKKYFFIVVSFALIACSSEKKESSESENTITELVEENMIPESETAAETIKNINAKHFKSFMAEGNYQLIDVRTPEEFEGGTIENAINIDFRNPDFLQNILTLNPNKKVLVFCQAGKRGGMAMDIMAEQGFTEVYNLEGGYGQWLNE